MKRHGVTNRGVPVPQFHQDQNTDVGSRTVPI
jgi:hypothetical protein